MITRMGAVYPFQPCQALVILPSFTIASLLFSFVIFLILPVLFPSSIHLINPVSLNPIFPLYLCTPKLSVTLCTGLPQFQIQHTVLAPSQTTLAQLNPVHFSLGQSTSTKPSVSESAQSSSVQPSQTILTQAETSAASSYPARPTQSWHSMTRHNAAWLSGGWCFMVILPHVFLPAHFLCKLELNLMTAQCFKGPK